MVTCLACDGCGLFSGSGMLAKDTICAEMAFMLMERNREGSTIDYPLQGSRGIVDALVRGIEKNGGRVMLRARVEDILIEGQHPVTEYSYFGISPLDEDFASGRATLLAMAKMGICFFLRTPFRLSG